MKLSVIVTTYNRPDALERVLDGLLNQTSVPHEIIVADDGSGQQTSNLVKHIASLSFHCPVIHVWHEDLGFRLAEVRNRAILRSSGDYIVSIDGDCIPGRHFIQDHELLAKPGFFFQGKRVIVERELEPFFDFDKTNRKLELLIDAFKLRLSNAHHLFRIPLFPALTSTRMSGIRGCNMGFFREDLLAVNGFNQDFKGWGREDSELAARLYNHGVRRREHPFMALCFHLWHPENEKNYILNNDAILNKTLLSGSSWCENGLIRRSC